MKERNAEIGACFFIHTILPNIVETRWGCKPHGIYCKWKTDFELVGYYVGTRLQAVQHCCAVNSLKSAKGGHCQNGRH